MNVEDELTPQLELYEMVTWVVMEARIGTQLVWAWCEAGPGPGFKSMQFTGPDGMAVPDLEEAPSRLERHLFSVTVPR